MLRMNCLKMAEKKENEEEVEEVKGYVEPGNTADATSVAMREHFRSQSPSHIYAGRCRFGGESQWGAPQDR